MSGIVPPGPELEPKIKVIAAKLSKMTKSAADDLVKKLLSSARAAEVFFVDPSDMFYPYFLQQLTLFRSDTKLADAALLAAKEKEATGAASAPVVSTTAAGRTQRSGGNVSEEVLRQIEGEAKQCTKDAHPDIFDVNRDGTVECYPKAFNLMSVTAQYVAKYGQPFLNAVRRKHADSDAFKFLKADDPRYVVFKELEVAYQTILCSTDEEAEERLERYSSPDQFLKICEAKAQFMRGEIARKKASLLTDDELRRRLEWDAFTVVQSFTIKDLGLNASSFLTSTAAPAVDSSRFLAPPQAVHHSPAERSRYVAPPAGVQTQATFMSSTLVRSADPSLSSLSSGSSSVSAYPRPPQASSSHSGGLPPVAPYLQPPPRTTPSSADDSYQTRTAYTHRPAIEHFVDPETGERLPINRAHEYGAAQGAAAVDTTKRAREESAAQLASDEEYGRNVLSRLGEKR